MTTLKENQCDKMDLLVWFRPHSETFTAPHLSEHKAERETDTTALQMIKAIICSHEADASGTAKCLLPGLGVKTRFLIWFPTEKLKKDKWKRFRRRGIT